MKEKVIFTNIQSDKVFKILKNFDETKASGIGDISGIFLKDDAKLLTRQEPNYAICQYLLEHFLIPTKKQS